MGVSRVLSLLNSDIFDITLSLYTSVSMCRIAHLVLKYYLLYRSISLDKEDYRQRCSFLFPFLYSYCEFTNLVQVVLFEQNKRTILQMLFAFLGTYNHRQTHVYLTLTDHRYLTMIIHFKLSVFRNSLYCPAHNSRSNKV